MLVNIIAFVCIALISSVIPLSVFIGMLCKSDEKKGKAILLFLLGAGCYIGMQWGVKEHGLNWLFNNTGFLSFMNNHYIPYLLVVSLAGAVLMIFVMGIIYALFHKTITFLQVVMIGLGYTMAESVLLVGISSVKSIISLVQKKEEVALSVGVVELYLSGYERFLMSVIQIAIVVFFMYMLQKQKKVVALVVSIALHSFATFFPAFILAFSTTAYYEVFERSIALLLVYIVLTVATVCSFALLYNLQYKFVTKSK